jgi:aminopeptidase
MAEKKKRPTSGARLLRAARTAVNDCLAVKSKESVLVITDEEKRAIGLALWEAAREAAKEAYLLEILPRSTHGEEPPRAVAELMQNVDVALCPTSKSLTHTDARRNASARGVRIATLPGITEDMMVRCLSADYQAIAKKSRTLARLLDRAGEVRVTSPSGTDLVLPIRGRKAIADTGLFHKKGEMGNLPAGEAFLAPLEGKSRGTLVVDASMAAVGKVKKPIRIAIEKGQAGKIQGGAEARQLERLLEPHGRKGRNVAELGIGTNDKARVTGLILEDEKVLGTVHVAFGDNVSMGGKVSVASHLDGLVLRPTLFIDDRRVMRDGKMEV